MPADTRNTLILLILACFWSAAPRAEGLGRLLTSPEERRLIAASLGGPLELEAEHALVRFEGVMEVDGGRLAVWVNGRRFDHAGELEQRGMVLVQRRGAQARLAVLGEDGLLHRLAPGQVFDRIAGRVLEPWEVPEEGKASLPQKDGTDRPGSPDAGKQQATGLLGTTGPEWMPGGEEGSVAAMVEEGGPQ